MLAVNEIFCGELKTQLEEVKIQRDEAKNVEELLSAMTCLSVHCVYSMGPIKRYSCKLIDGHLKGRLDSDLFYYATHCLCMITNSPHISH